jgi:thioredoxin-like negative regulator of GroEL
VSNGVGTTPYKSSSSLYLFIGLAVIAATIAIYILSKPDEKIAPATGDMPGPAESAQSGQLPEGHPPMRTGPTPEQQAHITALRQAYLADSTSDSARVRLANAYYYAEMYAEAIPLYRTYVERNPNDNNARTDYGTSLAGANDLDAAIVQYKHVLTREPKHQSAALNLALMYMGKRNRDSVLYWLGQVVAIDSTSEQGHNAKQILVDLENAHRDSAK